MNIIPVLSGAEKSRPTPLVTVSLLPWNNCGHEDILGESWTRPGHATFSALYHVSSPHDISNVVHYLFIYLYLAVLAYTNTTIMKLDFKAIILVKTKHKREHFVGSGQYPFELLWNGRASQA